MVIASRDFPTFPQEDIRKVFYVRNYEWAFKMTFRYLGQHEATVATVHDTFLRLFRSIDQGVGLADPHGRLFDERWVKEIFMKAAVNAALQWTALDTTRVRKGHVQTYLRELAVWDGEGDDPSQYRNAIAQLLLLPVYPRLAYNICVIEGWSGIEAAGLLGIGESQVAGYVQKARALLKNKMAFIGTP